MGPSAEEIARLEAEDTTSQSSTPEVSRAPSRIANFNHQAASASETPSTPGTPGSIPSDTASSGGQFFIRRLRFIPHVHSRVDVAHKQ